MTGEGLTYNDKCIATKAACIMIFRQIMKILADIVVTVLCIAVMAVLVVVSLSGPYTGPPAEPPVQSRTLDDFIPQGTRTDSNIEVNMLDNGVISPMPLERYIIGVLAAEMPVSFESEALKAQAVAIRTNVLYRMNVKPSANHPDAHVCTDFSCCMTYIHDEELREKWGADYVRYINRIISAVLDTDGSFMVYRGKPILAVFHSSSAGKTESSGSIWPEDLPYLQSVNSPETAELVPDFVTTVAVPADVFRSTIMHSFPFAEFGDDKKTWIRDVAYNNSGRIHDIIIGGVAVRGTELRAMFALRSTAVSVGWNENNVVFTVTGFGHGVGLSQYGAQIMAQQGAGYQEILRTYYTGIGMYSPL